MNETAPLFRTFRALGYVSDDVPFAVQRRGKVTARGRARASNPAACCSRT